MDDNEMRKKLEWAWREQFERDLDALAQEYASSGRSIAEIMDDWFERTREMVMRRGYH